MDKKQLKQRQWLVVGFIILLFIVGSAAILLTNSNFVRQPSPTSIDPQTGVRNWINAVNAHDYHRLYTLTPDYFKSQIDESGFIQAQTGNPLFADGRRIAGFQVLNQTLIGGNSTIATVLELDIAGEGGNNTSSKVPLFMKFIETFEHGEWKVWTG